MVKLCKHIETLGLPRDGLGHQQTPQTSGGNAMPTEAVKVKDVVAVTLKPPKIGHAVHANVYKTAPHKFNRDVL